MTKPPPPLMASEVIDSAKQLRDTLQGMLNDDEFDTVSELLLEIEEGIEEAMSDAYAQGRQEEREEGRP